MEKHTLIAYSPGVHAAERNPAYPGKYVVESSIPLADIIFSPDDDELAFTLGFKDPDACPIGRENLTAVAETPQIRGYEKRQHLTVECVGRVSVVSEGLAYPTCVPKMARAGIDPNVIPADLIRSSQAYQCPFSYLGGMVVDGLNRAEVAVDAKPPHGDSISFQAV